MVKTFKELFEERIGKAINKENIKFLKKDDDRFVEIDDVQKMNRYHDALGRFTWAPTHAAHGSGGGTSASQSSGGSASKNSVSGEPVKNPISKPSELKKYEELNSESEKLSEIDRGIDYVERNSSTQMPKAVERKMFDADKVIEETNCTPKEAERAHELATSLYEDAVASEPKITKALVDVAKENGGEMYGLAFRLKDETSLSRKIISDSKEKGSYEDAAKDIKDAVRYTMVFDDDRLASGYKNVSEALEKAGFTEMRCKNYWAQYDNGGAPIKSVQCVFTSPNGQTFELQFHTYRSQGAKELCHPMYEKWREEGTSEQKKNELNTRMTECYSFVSNPKGVSEVNEFDAYKGKPKKRN